MLHDLAAQDSSTQLSRRLSRYTTPTLLCCDEVGYLAYDTRYADLLFEVITRRYQLRRPLVLTTNRAFSEWNQVFPTVAPTPASLTPIRVSPPKSRAFASP
jgi:DNA replication protein DnaC